MLRQQADIEVVGLLTTINESKDRVSLHAVRRPLLEAQAASAGLPLWHVPLPDPCSNEQYEAAMADVVERARSEGIRAIAFGDLFLQDVRAYREERLAGTGIAPLFPLWQRPTDELAREMLSAGVRAYVTCVDRSRLAREQCGRVWDERFIRALPVGVDPCGENGEFHTFVAAGPMLQTEIDVVVGAIVEQGGFAYADLMLTASGS